VSAPLPTPVGSVRFERARERLAKLLNREVETITDAEVIAYLAGG
jgi:hypothetical protein